MTDISFFITSCPEPITDDVRFDLVLWPLFHYILWDEATDGRIEKKSWDDYVFVNQQFADAILEQYQTGDIGMFFCLA